MRTRLLTTAVCAALLALAMPGEAAVPSEDPQDYLAITGIEPDPERGEDEIGEIVATLTNVGDRPLTAWVVHYGGREYGSRTGRSSDLVNYLRDPASLPNRLLPGETATTLVDPRLKHTARVVTVVFEDDQFVGNAERAHKIFRRRARDRQDLRLWLDAMMQARLEMATLDDPRPPIRALIEDQELVAKASASWSVTRSIQSALEMALVAPQILPKGDTLAAVDELIDAAVLGIEGLDRAIPPTFDGLTFPPLPPESEPIVEEEPSAGCSTLVLDLGGDGFRPSVPSVRVAFDLDGDGRRESVPWLAGSDDAFVALDRNGNGSIDDGTELFSDHSKQHASYRRPNGFDALAVFDSRNAGGDGDGRITAADAIYSRLVLWLDRNRDGESAPSELVSLAAEGVAAIDLGVWSAPVATESGEVLRYWGGYWRSDGSVGFAADVVVPGAESRAETMRP